MTTSVENPFKYLVESLNPDDPQQRFYNLSKLGDPRYGKQHLALSHLHSCVLLWFNRLTCVCWSDCQSACRFPSASCWSQQWGTVMNSWSRAPTWKTSSTGSKPSLKMWRFPSDQLGLSCRTSRMFIQSSLVVLNDSICIEINHLQLERRSISYY